MPRISAAQRERTYSALLDAVVELTAERGFEAVSMKDIAEHAGLARSAIYNYADDKAALLIAATERGSVTAREVIASVANDTARTAPHRLDKVLRLVLGGFIRDVQMLYVLRAVQYSLSPEQRALANAPFRRDVGASLARIIQDGIGAGDYREVTDLPLTLDLLVGAVEAALDRIIENPDCAAEAIDTTSTFLHNALAGRATAR